VVALATSVDDLVVVAPGPPWPTAAPVESPMLVETMSEAWEELAPVMSGADGVSQCAASTEVDGAGPQLGDDEEGLLLDLVRRGANIDVLGSAATHNVAPAPGSSGIVSPRESGLPLPGSPGFLPPHIDWRRVRDEVESACSQVATMERLVHETLASVGWNILRPIRVSFEKNRENLVSVTLASSILSHLLLCGVFAAPVLG
jgi:hypothetical protein